MRNNKRQTNNRPNVRNLKVHAKTRFNGYSQKDIPEIKLCGNWLENLGFQFGATVTVTSMPNLLIIRTTQ